MNQIFNKVHLWWVSVIQKLGGRVVASLIAAMVMTLIGVVISDGWMVAIAKENRTLKLLNENTRDIATLKASLFHAESAQRGYLVTEKAAYLTPFTAALTEARTSIKQLRANFDNKLIANLNGGNLASAERQLLQEIAVSVESKATEMAMTIQLAKSGHMDDARQIVNLDQGLQEASRFTASTERLTGLQLQMLAKVRGKLDNYILLTRVSLISTAIALSLLVIVVIRQLVSAIAHKDKLSRDLAIERVTLQAKLEDRTRLLETLAVDYQYDVERERRQLARELHDELGSILTATKMDISWVIRKFKESSPEAAEKLVKTIRYLDQGIQFKRRIVEALHPSILSTFGFWAAMKNFVESAAERNEWSLQLSLPDESTPLSEALGLIAYRIVQETLNNASKYAMASQVSVSIIVDFKYLKLEIEDNGVGMDISNMGAETHGLTGMRHRVQAIGGQLEILSKPGEGVFTRALLPLESTVMATASGLEQIKINTPQSLTGLRGADTAY